MGASRPPFKPTKAQRNRVKLLKADGWANERIALHLGISRNTLEKAFVEELEFGADAKTIENLENAERAAKKGNASMIKWLADRFAAGRAAQRVEARASQPSAEEPERSAPKLGKKELQQQAAEQITGKFAPPPAPKLH